MRMAALLLFISFMQASATGFSQKVTLQVKDAPLQKVFLEISRQTGYSVVCNEKTLAGALPVTLNVRNEPLQTALEKCFRNQPFGFAIENKTLVIKPLPLPAPLPVSIAFVRLAGKVVDEKGAPLERASINIAGTTRGVLTNEMGEFSIDVKEDETIVISLIGYKTQEIAVAGKNTVHVVMVQSTTELENVVVVGYGRQKKQSVVSSISTVQADEIKFPTRSLSNNIAGQVAGLIAIQRSGEPGYDNSEFWIRGISTFAGGPSPLVLVDGIPRAINDIEPDEIETFSILKDAAATAVYGAEGANGVVIITSKRGKAQKPVISFRTEHSVSQPTRLPKFVGAADYLTLYNEALANDGELPMFSEQTIEKYRSHADADLYPDTDWQNAMLKDATNNHRYTLNVRGGSERARFFVSGAYFSESGIFKSDPGKRYETNIGLKRFNLRSNIDLEVSNTTMVSVDLSGQYLLTNYPGTGTDAIFRQMLITPPYVFPPVYSDGTVATFEKERDANMRNPYNMLMNSGYAKEWRTGIQSNVRLEQKLPFLLKGLVFRGNVSYDFDGNFYSRRSYNPSRYFATGRDAGGKLLFSRTFSGTNDMTAPDESYNANKKVYVESSLNYNAVFGRHTVGAMALYMQKESQQHSEALAFRKQGVVGRVTYSFDSRYYFEGNFGYTGSESFAKGFRFGFFPAVGIGYMISNEAFYPESLKGLVPSLKLRASIGRTGNDNNGQGERFLYRPTFNMGSGTFNQGITSGGGSNAIGSTITEGRFNAPFLGWEIEDKQNYGIDVNLFRNKVEIIADYFVSERRNILLQRRTIPASAGFRQAPWENFGRVRNWGIDGSINARQHIGNVKLSARGTFTFARNKITEYDELPQPYPWMAWTGSRVNENTLYIAEGLYTHDDFTVTDNPNGTKSYTLKGHLPKPTLGGLLSPGDIRYKDLNNDGRIDAFDRKRGVGNPYNPEIVYGFGLNAEWKGFYMSTFLQGTGNTSVVLGGTTPEGWYPFSWGVEQSNYRTFALDRWTEANPRQDAVMPRLHSINSKSANNNQASTWWLRNGAFLRLKNVELGYNVPKPYLERFKLKTARIYLMGYNLTVWDHIKYWDPETGNGNGGFKYPLPRTFTLGLETTF